MRCLRMGGARGTAHPWRCARHAGGTTRTLCHNAADMPLFSKHQTRVRAEQGGQPGEAGCTIFLSVP